MAFARYGQARPRSEEKVLSFEICANMPPMRHDSDSPSGVSEVWGEALEKTCPGKVLPEYQE